MKDTKQYITEQVTYAIDWEIGGLENEVMDGFRDTLPTLNACVKLVAESVLNNRYNEGSYQPYQNPVYKEFGVKNLLDLVANELLKYYPFTAFDLGK